MKTVEKIARSGLRLFAFPTDGAAALSDMARRR
jgi:hypothetical protein